MRPSLSVLIEEYVLPSLLMTLFDEKDEKRAILLLSAPTLKMNVNFKT
jgi:hypothetical protein